MTRMHQKQESKEPSGSVANRQCVRVPVPQELFREAALWIRPRQTPVRMHLKELGPADRRCVGPGPGLRIEDISANGLRLTLDQAGSLGKSLERLQSVDCTTFLYLKLAQPLTVEDAPPLSLFLGAEPVLCRVEDDRLTLAMTILHRGQPDKDDKSMTFFYVARFAVRELAAWCDEVTLMDHAPLRPPVQGLRMDRFLLELDSVLAKTTME